MKIIKKTLSFLIAIIMVCCTIIIPSNTEVYADSTSNYTYFPVTMFNYNTNTINAATGSGGILFNRGAGSEAWNKWTGSSGGVYAGIAKSELTASGDIEFNYPQGGIFDTNISIGKEFFTDVKMPFKYEDGYYLLDSNQYDVYFKDGIGENGATLIANETQKIMNCIDKKVTGFFPFDGAGDTEPTYHFGMNMAVNC